ncbi:hypothetical protein [Pedobacter hartonius]|uniref:hypothetical protein n=1 Tax=Pedobacter hartonius TaxID=425514 RepID=UPI0015875D92|nr:hypothetical protein [Pedobacter hartonius]
MFRMQEMDMGLALMNQYAETFDVSRYEDTYHKKLLKLIECIMLPAFTRFF